MRCVHFVDNAAAAPATVSGEPATISSHWDRLILGRWSKAVTREPGDLLPAMVMRERVGRGAPKRCKSRRVCRIEGEKAGFPASARDGLYVRRRACRVSFQH